VRAFLLSWALPALTALAPAALKLARNRRLAARLDDPTLPERLLVERQLVTFAFAASIAVIAVLWFGHLIWVVPLALTSVVAAGFPLRRRLLGESWSVRSYLWFMFRLAIATQGIWLLIAVAPVLTDHPGWAGWASSAALGIVLVLWNDRFADVLRAILRALPVEDPDLVTRFTALVGRTDLPMPRFDVVRMNGGVFANAAALPTLRRSGVLFTDTLLTRFTPEEVTAVCAHELAHLEHFNPRRLRWMRGSTLALILVAVSLAPALRAAGSSPGWRWDAGLIALVLAYLAVLSHKRQEHETASDLRAVTLTGSSEPMVSALIKLHVLARLPRRWDQSLEQHASHPSFARRIAAIRAAATTEPLSLGATPAFAAADGSGRAVTFEDHRIVWTEAGGSTHALPYARLVELRVRPGRAQGSQLVAADTEGRRWRLALLQEDVSRVQAVLDVVDVRLYYGKTPASGHPVVGLVASLAGLIAMSAGQVAAAIVLLLSSFDRSPQTGAAAAAAALVGAGVYVRDGAAGFLRVGWWTPVVLVLTAMLLASVVWRSRGAPPTRTTRRIVTMLTMVASLLLVPLAIASTDGVGFHQAARAWSAFTVLASAVAAALALWPARWARRGGLAAALAAGVTLLAGTTTFLERAIADPFLVDAPVAREVRLAGEPVARIDIPAIANELRLSPGGEYVAAVEGESDQPRRYHVARPGGDVRVITTETAAFVDDRTLITSEQVGDAAIVRSFDPANLASPKWEHRIDGVIRSRLAVDDAAGSWRVLAHEPGGDIVSVEGTEGGALVGTTRWPAEAVQDVYPVGVSGTTLAGLEFRYPTFVPSRYWLWPILGTPRHSARLWRVLGDRREPIADSALSLDCGGLSKQPTCAVFDGSRTRVIRVEVASGGVVGLARFPDRVLAPDQHQQAGWFSGFSSSGDAVAIHLDSATLFRPPDLKDEFAGVVTGSARRVATLSIVGDGSTIRIYDAPLDLARR
jgi:Zn-dependent protease with chaperone function